MSDIQRQAKKLIKAGYPPARAVLMLAALYRLSLNDCELLFFAITSK